MIRITCLFTVILIGTQGLYGKQRPGFELLGKEFVTGLNKRAGFNDMKGIFLFERDYDGFIEELLNIKTLDPEFRETLTDSAEVENGRNEQKKVLKEIAAVWNGSISRIKEKNLKIIFDKVIEKHEKLKGVTQYNLDIRYYVISGKQSTLKSARVNVVMFRGSLKIIMLKDLKI